MNLLLLALLAGGYLRNFSPQYSVFFVLAVGAFAMLELTAPKTPERWRNLARLTLVMFVLFLIVVGSTLLGIYLRHTTAPYEYIHDGAIQIEEAVKFLLAGQNPYGADYAHTPMANWHFSGAAALALKHNGYLPFTFLLALPFYLVSQSTLGWFDIRFVYLPALVITWLLLPHLTDTWDKKLGLLIVVGLNPLFVPFFIEGRNDGLILFWVTLTLFLLQRKYFTAAAFTLGLVCATKQTAWFILPCFLAFFFFGPLKSQWRSLAQRVLVPLAVPFVLILSPFIVWNASAFIDDTLIYPAVTFPAAGYGANQLLLLSGILPVDTAPFPFVILQLLFGVPTLLLLWHYQRAHPSLRVMLAASAVLTLVVAFFNRVFQDNYIGYIIALGSIAYFLPSESTDV